MKMRQGQSHYNLRLMLQRRGSSQEEMAAAIGRCVMYVSHRMTDQKPWTTDDIYAIRNFVNSLADPGEPELVPLERLHEFFPSRTHIPQKQNARKGA